MSSDTSPLPSELRDRLRDESPEARSDLERVWALLETVDEASETDANPDAAWAELVEKHPELDATPEDGHVDAERGPRRGRETSARRQRPARERAGHGRTAVRWGVAVVVAVLVGGAWFWQQPVRIEAPPGQQRTAALPDGSTIELNSGTSLTYRRGFQTWPFVDAESRRVQIEGEAFFDVVHGERPFVVNTENANVTVEGTSFNVWVRSEAQVVTEVTMVDGRVRVAPRHGPADNVVLSDSGETTQIVGTGDAPTDPRVTPLDRVLAWRDDGFAVRAKPLSAVIRELERRYGATVDLHSSVGRVEKPLSLYYPGATDLETILHDLCTARDLNYRSTSRGFEVFDPSQ